MLHLLLVDDEQGQIIGFSRILQRLRPTYRICTARNGLEAIKLCEHQVFDLIFTDIQMPLMNGLEFMEQFRKINSDNVSKIVILSGYDYFEYAQKALTYGAFAYLLKPLDLEALKNLLELAEKTIEQEANNRREIKQISQKMLELLPAYSSIVLQQWINGDLSEDKVSALAEILSFHGAGQIALTKLFVHHSREQSQKQSLLHSLQRKIETVLCGEQVTFCTIPDMQHDEFVIVFSGCIDETIEQMLSEELKSYSDFGIAVAIGISRHCDDVIDSAHTLFKEAQLSVQQKFYDPDRLLFLYDINKPDPCYKPVLQPKEEDQLLDVVRNGQVESIRPLLTDIIYSRIIKVKYPMPEMLRNRCKLLMIKIIEGIEYLRECDLYDEFANEIETRLDDVLNDRQLIDTLEDLMIRAVNTIAELRLNRKENMVYQCLEYIDNHFMEDISLDHISDKFDLSPGYFSQYFKNKLDINFSKYLNQVRLNKAKKILETQEDKVYEVATKVGYQEVKYFNRVFKKEFGMTPEEFRKMIRTMKQK